MFAWAVLLYGEIKRSHTQLGAMPSQPYNKQTELSTSHDLKTPRTLEPILPAMCEKIVSASFVPRPAENYTWSLVMVKGSIDLFLVIIFSKRQNINSALTVRFGTAFHASSFVGWPWSVTSDFCHLSLIDRQIAKIDTATLLSRKRWWRSLYATLLKLSIHRWCNW